MPTTPRRPASGGASRYVPSLGSHLTFTALCVLALLAMMMLLRVALAAYNHDLIDATTKAALPEAFLNGGRFDFRLIVYICAPLVLSLVSVRAMAARRLHCVWLTLAASIVLLLGVAELNFYREFHQRLNSLVFQYLQEDLGTVTSMIWNGFPVVRLLLAWALVTLVLGAVFFGIERSTRATGVHSPPTPLARGSVFIVCLLVAVATARGTLRSGPPLRWGDAYTTDSMFANHLGLNGTLMLIDAAENTFSDHREKSFKPTMPNDIAEQTVRQMLLTPNDQLIDADRAPVRRLYTPPAEGHLPGVRNVVVILMESMAGRYIGAMGNTGGITPNFDALAKQGLLFDHFFSNGTHTHQGMFATMACFPNLPSFEYLMRTPEGSHQFSGLPQLLSARHFDDRYVYNGSFAWDNQSGFFSNQGMRNFVGREDFVNPVFIDPTWGVSDQDMFDRSVKELRVAHESGKPFYALLQTLSNHTPYALPTDLPVERVTGHGSLDEHLTAMRYADWALGRFFSQARQQPWYKDTLFVVLGDHGFGNPETITDMDLSRFSVPLLLVGPGVQETFGSRRSTVGSQVDVVPTIMGRLGQPVQHQCWGRDLLALPESDPGLAVIKPSGSDQTVALVTGNRLLMAPPGLEPRLYEYRLGANASGTRIQTTEDEPKLKQQLDAYLQMATEALLQNRTGATASPAHQ